MKRPFAVALAALLPTGLAGSQAQPAPIQMPLAERVAAQYQAARLLVTRIADKMPAEHYGFSPAPEMRTFAGNVMHLVTSNVNQCGNLLGRRHETMGGPEYSKAAASIATKAEAAAALAESFKFCDLYFDGLDADSSLTGEHFSTFIMRDGQRVPVSVAKGALVSSLIAHNNEVYGYMAVYLRLKGIVPPSSEPRPGRSGGASRQ
jgi:hypothetical protein